MEDMTALQRFCITMTEFCHSEEDCGFTNCPQDYEESQPDCHDITPEMWRAFIGAIILADEEAMKVLENVRAMDKRGEI